LGFVLFQRLRIHSNTTKGPVPMFAMSKCISGARNFFSSMRRLFTPSMCLMISF